MELRVGTDSDNARSQKRACGRVDSANVCQMSIDSRAQWRVFDKAHDGRTCSLSYSFHCQLARPQRSASRPNVAEFSNSQIPLRQLVRRWFESDSVMEFGFKGLLYDFEHSNVVL